MLTAFLAPDLGKQLHGFLAIPAAVAEIWTLGYLLVNGVRVPSRGAPSERSVVPASRQAG
jgi:hypothetical protein